MTRTTEAAHRGDDVPGPARLLRDLVNTAEPQTGGESLVDPGAAAAWGRTHGLLPAGADLDADDVALVVAVREGLRAVLHTHAGHAAPADALAGLDGVLDAVPLRASFDASGDLRLAAADTRPVAVLVAGVVDAVRESAADGSWDRLKVCARDSCRWAFYDTSRNRSARWCSMAGCGNLVKMQRAHARRREGVSLPTP
jgi:predicted RNA-binding Zn ribbon-like protein